MIEKIDFDKLSNFKTWYNKDGQPNETYFTYGLDCLSMLGDIDYCFKMLDYSSAFIILRGAWLFSNTYVIDRLGLPKVISYFERSRSFLNVDCISTQQPSIMTNKEIEYLESIENELFIYRGGEIVDQIENISWTFSEETAAYYANRRNGVIKKGVVNKNNVLCVLFDEQEIIVKSHSVRIVGQYLPEVKVVETSPSLLPTLSELPWSKINWKP